MGDVEIAQGEDITKSDNLSRNDRESNALRDSLTNEPFVYNNKNDEDSVSDSGTDPGDDEQPQDSRGSYATTYTDDQAKKDLENKVPDKGFEDIGDDFVHVDIGEDNTPVEAHRPMRSTENSPATSSKSPTITSYRNRTVLSTDSRDISNHIRDTTITSTGGGRRNRRKAISSLKIAFPDEETLLRWMIAIRQAIQQQERNYTGYKPQSRPMSSSAVYNRRDSFKVGILSEGNILKKEISINLDEEYFNESSE